MRTRESGEVLSELFLEALKNSGRSAKAIERRSGRPVVIWLEGQLLYVKYANLNKSATWYFGFHPDDVEKHKRYTRAILICGDRNLVSIYALPFTQFQQAVLQGALVPQKGKTSQYQLHIFPDRTHVAKVHGSHEETVIGNHRIIGEGFDADTVQAFCEKIQL